MVNSIQFDRGTSSKDCIAFSEMILSIVNDYGTETMASCILDTGCTKSMMLEQLTDQKQQNKKPDKDSIKYETQGSKLNSSMASSVGI
mmetsp:Transcript_50167/g.56035  ORF Transcript_50167/g.56035 Transcript_50167/m.56035 type:complete len:88 (-) Transcript_50167:642-905(-)